jgi:hypothetical protein
MLLGLSALRPGLFHPDHNISASPSGFNQDRTSKHSIVNMPGVLIQDEPFQTIRTSELHPSYGAEIIGADFRDMSDAQLKEIKASMAKVSPIAGSCAWSDTYH